MKTKRFLLAAGLVLALAFTFSCSGDDGDKDESGGGSSSSIGGSGSSSSLGGGGSSSSGGGQGGVVYGEPVYYEGETYQTVVIGTQTWMAKNLNYDVAGSKCYDNNPENCAIYGRLYNWNTAMKGASSSIFNPSGIRGVCPEGWHLPSQTEWAQLENFVGSSTAGTKLKATTGWDFGNGTDDYGFSALPGGIGGSDNRFGYVGIEGHWHSTTEDDDFYGNVNGSRMTANYRYVDVTTGNKEYLSSVRCVQDSSSCAGLNPSTHFCLGGKVTPLCGGQTYTSSQFCYKNSKVGEYCGREDIYDLDLYECKPEINPNGIYLKSKPKDIANKEYEAVLIGTQTWMAENLNYNVIGSRCYGDATGGDSQNRCGTYGRLYNWTTALTVCPAGWHLPSDAEWTTLENFVAPSGRSPIRGTKLKARSGWDDQFNGVIGVGTDMFGFSALPGGYGYSDGYDSDRFSYVGRSGYWWSASEYNDNASKAYDRNMDNDDGYVSTNTEDKSDLYSVRCVKD